jgi:hypothetical protein
MTTAELQEARSRLRVSAPHVSDAQFAAWVALATARGGVLELTLDGIIAQYDRADALQVNVVPDRGAR